MKDSLYTYSDKFDVLHYSIALDLTSTFASKKRIFEGKAELIIKSKTDTLNFLGIDAAKLKIDSVLIKGKRQAVLSSEEMLFINLAKIYNRDDTVAVSIYYRKTEENTEDKGFYYSDKPDVTAEPLVYTNSNQKNTKYWLPCVDDLRDKATVDLRVKVPAGYTVLSSGVLYKKESTGADDVFLFRNDLPISSYCISLAVSRFQHTSQSLRVFISEITQLEQLCRSYGPWGLGGCRLL